MGFALCGSFCTHGKVLRELEKLCKEYETVQPIVSEICLHTNTRFGTAEEFISAVEKITGHTVMGSVNEAEPIGPKKLLDVLVIAPCTGNTIGKLACGITDTAVTMAAKAHLRNDRPVVVAVSTKTGVIVGIKSRRLLEHKALQFFCLLPGHCSMKGCGTWARS